MSQLPGPTDERKPTAEFRIGYVIDEGMRISKGAKWPIHKALLLSLLVVIPAALIFQMFPSVLQARNPYSNLAMFLGFAGQFAYAFFLNPISAGIMLIGVSRASGEEVRPRQIFDYYDKVWPLMLAYIVMVVLVLAGLVLLVIPGIYLSVAYFFALPLVADKGLSFWQALETSRKAVTKHWFRMFGLMWLLVILNGLAAVLTLGIGLIWTLPWSICAMGVVYRQLFESAPAVLEDDALQA